MALEMGFGHVESGPLVRSSYHAHEQTQALESAATLNGRGASPSPASALASVSQQIVDCTRCARLRTYCQRIATEKKAAHRNRHLLGAAGAGLRRSAGARARPRPGARRARRQPHRPGVHRRRPGSGDFLMRAMHAPASRASRRHSRPTMGWSLSDALHRRGRALRAARQQADAGRDRGVPRRISSTEVAALPRVRVHRRAGPHRVRRGLATARRPRRRRPAAAAVRPRRSPTRPPAATR